MHIELADGQPTIVGLPEDVIVLFFGKLDSEHGYGIIYGPEEDCLPPEGVLVAELFSAKLAIGQAGEEMAVNQVSHGHKYRKGGGFVETKMAGQIFFRLPGGDLPSTYEGESVEQVYTVL